MKYFFTSVLALILLACSGPKYAKVNEEKRTELFAVHEMMTGTFSSRDQAARDSAFFDINLVMYPIWEKDASAKWLYVEQAVTANLSKPYRQRVYKLTVTDSGQIESSVFELPDPAAFVHAWNNPELFERLTASDLKVREGCSVFLEKKKTKHYAGATPEGKCISTLRGASYATSEVEVYPDRIVSWDRGWDKQGEQVWGAVKGGYVFMKIKN